MSITYYEAPSGHLMSNLPYARVGNDAFIGGDCAIEIMKAIDSKDKLGELYSTFGLVKPVSKTAQSDKIQIVKHGMDGKPLVIIRSARFFPRGPVREEKPVGTVDCLPIYTGGSIIAAPSNFGKTPLTEYIVDKCNGGIVRWGEPFPGFLSEIDELGALMAPAVASHQVIGVDSLKDLARNAGGTTMQDGLSSYFFTLLSKWSGHYASYGRAIVAPVNFSTLKDAAVQSGHEALKANATGIIVGVDKNHYEWIARPGVGKIRNSGRFETAWNKKGVDRLIGKANVNPISDEDVDAFFYNIGVFVKDNPNALAAAVARQISKSK